MRKEAVGAYRALDGVVARAALKEAVVVRGAVGDG